MTMKIFGAAMIVSGFYYIGRRYAGGVASRIAVLSDLLAYFQRFRDDFITRRIPFDEKDASLLEILSLKRKAFMSDKDEEEFKKICCVLKNGAYSEAHAALKRFITYLENTVAELLEKKETVGKAFPMVCGFAGCLLVVVLF